MDIQQLRYYVEVAQELHFGRAADQLHVTPSPLSRRIRELERELGVDLYVRGYHEVQLTDAGRVLLEPARDVLRRFDALKAVVREQALAGIPGLRVGGSPLTPPHSLDVLLETLREVDAETAGPIVLEPSAALLRMLTACELDVAVVHLPVDEPGLHSISIMEYKFSVALRADDALAGNTSLTLADLADHEYIMSSSKVHPVAMKQLADFVKRAGVKRMRELDTSDSATVAAHVARSRAFSMTVMDQTQPAGNVYADPRYVLIPLNEPNLHFRVGIAWRDERYRTDQALRKLIEAIRSRTPVSIRESVDA